jgi:hypothetical protein
MHGLRYFGDFVSRSPSDALMYGPLAFVSAVVGSGRFAFGVAWLLCLVAIAMGFFLYSVRSRGFASEPASSR